MNFLTAVKQTPDINPLQYDYPSFVESRQHFETTAKVFREAEFVNKVLKNTYFEHILAGNFARKRTRWFFRAAVEQTERSL